MSRDSPPALFVDCSLPSALCVVPLGSGYILRAGCVARAFALPGVAGACILPCCTVDIEPKCSEASSEALYVAKVTISVYMNGDGITHIYLLSICVKAALESEFMSLFVGSRAKGGKITVADLIRGVFRKMNNPSRSEWV